jgi:hypothetical protein
MHADVEYTVRGYYAADGSAAETGASAGNVWQVRFAPDQVGTWTYSARMSTGEGIAVDDNPQAGTPIKLSDATGSFEVTSIQFDEEDRDFRSRGRIVADDGYFRFGSQGAYWMKGGANSPENLLAFVDFDGTYRQQAEAREGEAAPPSELHRYNAHVKDWRPGDPTWRKGKGKGLIGAINYLASTGMNVSYFLTLNIQGDGKDVWPYADPTDFTRFDCSKLDQWEIVFAHMQHCGIMLHVVTQETENERMLDDGDVGFRRKLYYRELIARFAHHPALVWNLGEENGPADFSPNGQTPAQQRAMASYIRQHDPYNHPILMHTHATAKSKDELLPALLGHKDLDGLSFQINERKQVHHEVAKWRQKAAEAGHPWIITMDEIGQWHTGTVTDTEDPTHDSLRQHVLWGSLMAGAAGVEWYFGARHPHNDLNSEDWRQRANIWKQTHQAILFFDRHVPYWEMQPMPQLTGVNEQFCFAKQGDCYVVFAPGQTNSSQVQLDLQGTTGQFDVFWFDPVNGGKLQRGGLARINGGAQRQLGTPPTHTKQDWVILIQNAAR